MMHIDDAERARALESRISRRSILGAGVGAAATVALATTSCGGSSGGGAASVNTIPIDEPPRTDPGPAIASIPFLLDRLTFGYRAATTARASALGYQAFLEEQLHPSLIPDAECDALLAPLSTLGLTAKQLQDQYYEQGLAQVPVIELKTAAILRAAFSERQLFERMVEFWTDHFNIDHSDAQANVLKTIDDRAVIRQHALGFFPEMLEASSHSAAMLYFLGNYRNTAVSPNENYAREIMELHSVGVGNFTEMDVREMSRCLTGWGYKQTHDPNYGEFFFDASHHDDGAKTLFGATIPAGGGVLDGQTAVRRLALHPLTAQFISSKMCRWLLSYTPTQTLVDLVAQTYMATHGDIKAMIRVIFAPTSVALLDSHVLPKLKRPFHLVAGVVRSSTIAVQDPRRLVGELVTLGQQPFGWVPPNGYPDTFQVWGSGLQARWTFLSRFFSNSVQGITVDIANMFGATPKPELAARANALLTGGRLAAADVDAVQDYANSFPTLTETLRRDVLTLTASSPSFQMY